MKFKVGLLVVCGALLLCVTGCRSTETQSFQVTPLTQTEQNSLEQLGEQLFVMPRLNRSLPRISVKTATMRRSSNYSAIILPTAGR